MARGVTSNFKQWRREVKKDLAAFEAGRDDGLKKMFSLIVTDTREDGFLETPKNYTDVGGWRRYLQVAGATIARKRGGKKIFHHSKFLSRTGKLRSGFKDLTWKGDTATNGADIRASVGRSKGELAITGYTETILRFHPVNRKTVHQIGKDDNTRMAKSDRGIVQRSSRRIVRTWKKFMKQAIDARLAGGGSRA
jgi:hypothetical protein